MFTNEALTNTNTRRTVNSEKMKQAIQAIFEKHEGGNQQDVVVDLYRIAVPDWDRIVKVKGHPQAGYDLNVFIFRCFMEFDRKHHPDVLPGGAWLNWGFSTNRNMDPWGIDPSTCSFEYE